MCNTATAGPAYHLEVLQPGVFIFRVLAWLFTCASFKNAALTTNALYSADEIKLFYVSEQIVQTQQRQ